LIAKSITHSHWHVHYSRSTPTFEAAYSFGEASGLWEYGRPYAEFEGWEISLYSVAGFGRELQEWDQA